MDEKQLAAVVEPVLADHGLELETIKVTPIGKRNLLKITVDGEGPTGRGPLLDDISLASQDVSRSLDDSPAVGNAPYTLEITTRGVAAPLIEPKHYRRNTGRLVQLTLPTGQVTGRIRGVTDTGVELDVDGSVSEFAFDQITKAVVQIEMNRPVEEA